MKAATAAYIGESTLALSREFVQLRQNSGFRRLWNWAETNGACTDGSIELST
jgi:hypothetical protein